MRRRITVLAMATALLAVVLLAVPLGALAARNYLKDERLELQQAAASYAASVRGDLSGGRLNDHEISASVYDATGRRVSGNGPSTPPQVVAEALTGHEASTSSSAALSVAAPVSDGDRVTGAVLLRTSLDAARHRTLMAWLALAAMGIGAVAVSGLAARLVAARLTGPIDRLVAVARRIGSGDLTARAEASRISELNILGTALNDSTTTTQRTIVRERALSAEVSHQLRTPLSALRLALESGNVDRALPELDRLDATITELIALARDIPSAGEATVRPILDDAARRWHGRLAAQARPLRLVTDSGSPVTVNMSAAAVGHVLDVLIENAFHHGKGAITVQARMIGSTAAIEVSDEGPALIARRTSCFAVARTRPAVAWDCRWPGGSPRRRELVWCLQAPHRRPLRS